MPLLKRRQWLWFSNGYLAPGDIMVDKLEEQNLARTTADAPQRLRETDSDDELLPSAPLGSSDAPLAVEEVVSSEDAFAEPWTLPNAVADPAPAPWLDRLHDPGLRRHYTVIGGVFCFCAIILGLTLIDFSKMTRQKGMIDSAFRVHLRPALPELPASMVYSSDQYAPVEPLFTQDQKLLPVQQTGWNKDLYGFIDWSGKIVIPPKFSSVGKFIDGYAPVTIETSEHPLKTVTTPITKQGLIDENGKFVIPPKYVSISEMHEGVVVASDRGVTQLLKPNGQVVFTAPSSVNLNPLGSFFVAQRLNGRMGLIDASGHWLLPIEYDNITKFRNNDYRSQYMPEYATLTNSDDFFKIHRDGKCGVIDAHGKIVLEPKFEDIDSFADGHAVFSKLSKNGLADASGKVLLDAHYDSISTFAPLIALKRDYTYSFINSNGQQVRSDPELIPLVLTSGEWFADGLGPVLKGNKVGYVNAQGQLVIEPKFIWASPFNNGYAVVWDGRFWRFIDKTGSFASPERFFSVSRFKDGKSDVAIPGLLSAFLESPAIDDVESSIESTKENFTRWRPNASTTK